MDKAGCGTVNGIAEIQFKNFNGGIDMPRVGALDRHSKIVVLVSFGKAEGRELSPFSYLDFRKVAAATIDLAHSGT